jgi:hypothetical protein
MCRAAVSLGQVISRGPFPTQGWGTDPGGTTAQSQTIGTPDLNNRIAQ